MPKKNEPINNCKVFNSNLMNLLPKYIKYKIAAELSSQDLFNLHLTSKDNYQMYKSAEFWANKLKITTLDWKNRVELSGSLYRGYPNSKHYQI